MTETENFRQSFTDTTKRYSSFFEMHFHVYSNVTLPRPAKLFKKI